VGIIRNVRGGWKQSNCAFLLVKCQGFFTHSLQIISELIIYRYVELINIYFFFADGISVVRHAVLCSDLYFLNSLITSQTLNFWYRGFTFNSNKSPTWCTNFSVYYADVCLQLNRFRAFSRPSSGPQWLQWQPLVLPSYRGDSRVTFVFGLAGRPDSPTTNTARLSPRYEGKTIGCHCSHWGPDDGRENARNMLSCKQSQDNKVKNGCIRLVIYLNCTMMHGLTNLKFYI
jgi:hypothetical protein